MWVLDMTFWCFFNHLSCLLGGRIALGDATRRVGRPRKNGAHGARIIVSGSFQVRVLWKKEGDKIWDKEDKERQKNMKLRFFRILSKGNFLSERRNWETSSTFFVTRFATRFSHVFLEVHLMSPRLGVPKRSDFMGHVLRIPRRWFHMPKQIAPTKHQFFPIF